MFPNTLKTVKLFWRLFADVRNMGIKIKLEIDGNGKEFYFILTRYIHIIKSKSVKFFSWPLTYCNGLKKISGLACILLNLNQSIKILLSSIRCFLTRSGFSLASDSVLSSA